MLTGFGIAGYRSYGPEPQFVSPLSKINIFVGQNNVGKSNLLRGIRVVAQVAGRPSNQWGVQLTPDDAHEGKRSASPRIYLPLPQDAQALAASLEVRTGANLPSEVIDITPKILAAFPIATDGMAWFGIGVGNGRGNLEVPTIEDFPEEGAHFGGVHRHDWARVWQRLTSQSQGDVRQHWIPETLSKLSPAGSIRVGEIHYVEAHRKIGEPGSKFDGLNGEGLIARLLELQSPKLASRDASLAKFRQINGFLSSVTGVNDAKLEVDGEASELLVNLDGTIRRIEALGTGIHEVVILAAAATAFDNAILCIEEPEIHLHPRLQKRLMAFLSREPSNQYFITTHSAHILDCPGASLFHLQLNEYHETEVESLGRAKRAVACFDLGYRASDLVQANCVIWVEGPSDRTYINAWIGAVAEDLQEGTHYSIMFYGGRLLSHLSVSDDNVDEFIELQRLNRNVAIVIDSDRSKASDPINATKVRIADEIKKHRGLVWVTDGREVENYLSAGILSNALSEVHPKLSFKPAKTKWSRVYTGSDGLRSAIQKVRVAKAATRTVDLDVLDLRSRVEGLVAFIRVCNE